MSHGNHSTASGRVDDKVIFYIMSRGLSYKEAVKLLVKSNFSKIIDRIDDEELRNEIINKIDEPNFGRISKTVFKKIKTNIVFRKEITKSN